MADQTIAAGQKGSTPITLVAGTAYEVVFAQDAPLIEVVNPSGSSADLWYSNDGSTPTVGGTNCYLVPAGMADSREPDINGAATSPTIKLISSAALTGVRVQRGV